jgi:hypothetical protein
MDVDRCPRCGASTVEVGHLTSCGFPETLLYFVPSRRWFGWFRWNKGVSVGSDFSSCLSCGLVWSDLDPRELRTFIERHGSRKAKVALAPFAKPKGGSDLD